MILLAFKDVFKSVTSKIGTFSAYAKSKTTEMKAKWNSPDVQSKVQTKGNSIADSLVAKAKNMDDYRHKLLDMGPKDPYAETWAKYSQAISTLFGGSVPTADNSNSFEKE